MAVGIMAAAFEAALEFAKSDSHGGVRPIMNYQSVSDLLIAIKMKTGASKFLTWKAAHALDNELSGELALGAKCTAPTTQKKQSPMLCRQSECTIPSLLKDLADEAGPRIIKTPTSLDY